MSDDSRTTNDTVNSSSGDQSNRAASQGSTPSNADAITFDAHIVPIPVVTTIPPATQTAVSEPAAVTAQQAQPQPQAVPAPAQPQATVAPMQSQAAPLQPQIPVQPVQTQPQQPVIAQPAIPQATPITANPYTAAPVPVPIQQPPHIPPVAQQPPQQPYPPIVAGATNPVKTNSKKPVSKGLIVGIFLCVIALIGIGITLWINFGPSMQEDPAPNAPSSSQVESAYQGVDIDAPDIASFKYMNTEGLQGPKVNNYKASGVTREGDSFYCEGTATATYENDAVSIEVPLSMRMEYNADSNSWMRGTVREGTINSQPKTPADLQAIIADFPNILKAKDPNVANQFANSQITHEGSLTVNGGSIDFTLTKEIDGEQKTITAKSTVSWNKERGWVVAISAIEGLTSQQPEQSETPADSTETPSESSGGSSGGSTNNNVGGNTDLTPTMILQCWSGDLVEVPGTVQIQSSGRVLLKTDDVIRVEFNGKVFITTYFELIAKSGSSYMNGRHIIARGAISATGTLPEAPLVINEDYE